MATPADQLTRDRGLQEHWIRRFVAFIIDIIIFAVIVWILSIFIIFTGVFWFFGWSFLLGILFLLYSAFLEGVRGATIGKGLLKLKVVYNRGHLDVGKAFIRNLSKILWILLIIDLLLGFLTTGDPRQRYLDRIAETTVIDVMVSGYYAPPPPPQPYPR